ncbi:MAG: response regulator, partial [Opitutaceae bacterium]
MNEARDVAAGKLTGGTPGPRKFTDGTAPKDGQAPVLPRSILIVEDEPAIADTLVYALKTEGFAPEWCSTGRAALAALAAKPFALVVLDVGLPDGT